ARQPLTRNGGPAPLPAPLPVQGPFPRSHGDPPMSRPDPDPVRDTLARARPELSATPSQRHPERNRARPAPLARQRVLLVGPPPCAKSMLLEAVMRWPGGGTFTCLLTRFTTPEELFGPVSVAGLKEDKYRRITTGKLPEADGCFLDEVFKGSS